MVCLDPSTYDKYIGKTVNMRTPLTCQSEHICNKCAGDAYYILGIKHGGLTLTKAPNTILQINMKAFHDQTLNFNKLDWEKYIIN